MALKDKLNLSQDDILKALDELYKKSIDGLPVVSKPISEFANDYISKHNTVADATKAMLKNQITKCTTSGFITGFGGAITLPITIPANISSVLYVQMRMIACAAYMNGFELNSDQVQTLVYACLAGVSVNEIAKQFGVALGGKLAVKGIQKIPGKVLLKINQKIGFRLITKFGEKGLINLGKMVPVVGAIVNGGFDLVETKAIASRAYKTFVEKNFNVGEPINIDQ